MYVLGLSAFGNDSSAALIADGVIIAAAQEERFTRIKHDLAFPKHAIEYCLKAGGISLSDINKIAFCGSSFSRELSIFNDAFAYTRDFFACGNEFFSASLKNVLAKKFLLPKHLVAISALLDLECQLVFFDFDFCQAASAFYPSPYADAAIIALGGANSCRNTPIIVGRNNRITTNKDAGFSGSVGTLYSAFTSYAGFKINSGEYKLMGLSPYGKAKYADVIFNKILKIKDSGSFNPNAKYFVCRNGRVVPSKAFTQLFGRPERRDGEAITDFYMDLAASIQSVTEKIIIKRCRYIAQNTGAKNLCIAGDMAQNCVVNSKILEANIFENIWVQPAASGAGGALGAALAGYYLNAQRISDGKNDKMKSSLLGPSFAQADIENRLIAIGAVFTTLPDDELIIKTAIELTGGKAVGWVQGRMEFGSRALGNRSILADPRSPTMQKLLNSKIKYRESFRPFAPSVLQEDAGDWFNIKVEAPYMLLVAQVKEGKSIPAVMHVDGSARVQTVSAENNPRFYALLSEFKKITGCPVLVNTSFNVRGEPIVCSPEDAFRCFMGTDIDVLVIGNCFIEKPSQKVTEEKDYNSRFTPD